MPRGRPNKRAAEPVAEEDSEAEQAPPAKKKRDASAAEETPKKGAAEETPKEKKKRVPRGPAKPKSEKAAAKDEIKPVIEALDEAELPADALAILKSAGPLCLTTYSDARHPFQESVIDMLSEALTSVQAVLKKSVAEAETAVGGLNRGKKEETVLQAARAVAEAKCVSAHKEADIVGAKLKLKVAEDTLKPLAKAQTTGDADYLKLEAKKEKLEAVIKQVEEASSAVLAPKPMAALQKDFAVLELDVSLVASLAQVLIKDPAARSEFDMTALASLNTDLGSKRGFVTAHLKMLQPARDERNAAVTAAQAAQTSCTTVLDTVKASIKEAETAVKQAEKALDAAQDDFNDFGKCRKTAEDDIKEAKEDLAEFETSTMTIFAQFKSRQSPPPAEPKEVPFVAEANID